MTAPATIEDGRRLAVVPAYNESATILAVVEALRRHAPRYDVLVVDDGSTDDTAALADLAGARTLRLPYNLGIGGAVQAGFIFALEHGYSHMVQIDGDGQHDPGQIAASASDATTDPSLDMVCGSRFLTDDHHYPAPISRRTGIHIFAYLLSRSCGQRVSDPTSGFRLYNRRGIELFARDYPHDYPEVEAVLMLHHHRLSMGEVPVRMFERGGGLSSISSGKSAYYMVKVLSRSLSALARRRPVVSPATRRRSLPTTGSDGPHPARLRSSSPRCCCSACWSSCVAAGCSSATRWCGCSAAVVTLGLAVWRAACWLAERFGILYAPNALFFVALAFIVLLLLHFSAAVSRLTDQTKVLAQRLAILEERTRPGVAGGAARRGAGRAP